MNIFSLYNILRFIDGDMSSFCVVWSELVRLCSGISLFQILDTCLIPSSTAFYNRSSRKWILGQVVRTYWMDYCL